MSPAASLDAYPPARHDLHVEHYDLDLRYSPASNRLSGRATLRVAAGQSAEEGLERVRLDLHRLRVTRVRVDGEPARHTHHGPTLTVLLPRALAAGGAATVLVEYAGRPTPAPSPWGPVGWEELADGALAANQPTGARSWFPCLDEPGDRATYRTSVTVDQPYRAVAHGVLVSTTRGAGTTTFVYDEPRPTPTYLATVQVGRYEAYPIPAQGVPQQVVTAPAIARSVRASLELQGPLMAHHESVFGPYPFAGYTLVVTPDALEIPLEAQGMAIFGANHLHGEARRLLAHELAHQWFGNAVSVATWQHIWLNEGPACYAEWLWSAASGGPSEHTLARTWHRRLAVQPQDLVLADPGYRRIFDDRVYKRGALTCYALDVLLGRPAFSALLRSWVAERAGTSVTSDDFRAHVRAAAGRLGPRADALLGAWLDRPELPPLPSA